MRAILVVVTLFAAGFTVPASAGHCTAWTTSEPYFYDYYRSGWPLYLQRIPTGATGTAGVYVHYDAQGYTVEFWIYAESNGIPGWQRGDENKDDTCHGMIKPDTVIF